MNAHVRYSSFEGRISSILHRKRLIIGVYLIGQVGVCLNGQFKILAKDDPSLPFLWKANRGREKIVCIFRDGENLSQVIALFKEPKGNFLKMLREERILLERGDISVTDFMEDASEFSSSFYLHPALRYP